MHPSHSAMIPGLLENETQILEQVSHTNSDTADTADTNSDTADINSVTDDNNSDTADINSDTAGLANSDTDGTNGPVGRYTTLKSDIFSCIAQQAIKLRRQLLKWQLLCYHYCFAFS